MSQKLPKKQPNQPPEGDLQIHRDDLDDVLAIAAQLQAEAKDAGDDTFEGKELDTITATTGISRDQLAGAKKVLDERRRARRKLALMGVGAIAVTAALTSGLWWKRVFPPDARALAFESSVLTGKADALRAKEDYDQALELALVATRKDPTNFKAWNVVGLSYAGLNKPGEARQAYMEGIRIAGIQPEAVDLYFNMGTMLNHAPASREEAIGYFKQALQCKPDHASSYNNMGYGYEKLGRLKEARAAYEEALRINPNYKIARDNLNLIRAKLDPPPSVAGLDKHLKAVEARDAITRLRNAKQYKQAIAYGLKAVREFPKEVQVWNALGLAYMDDGQKVEAARTFTRATEVGGFSHDSVYPYYNLGRLASETSDDSLSEAYLRKALRCAPEHAWSHQYLAQALERQGKKAEAISEYRAALKASPTLTEAQRGLVRLGVSN